MAKSTRPIFLVGFMGAGKTSVGRVLAQRLGWIFIDLDELIVEEEHRPIAGIFDEMGEGYFRRLESRLLASMRGRTRLVVACGGGSYAGREGRTIIDGIGRAVWLDLSLSRALERCDDGVDRPMIRDAAQAGALYRARLPWYSFAPYRIDVEHLTPEQAAEGIARLLET